MLPASSLKVKVGEGKPDMPDVDLPVSTTYPIDEKVVQRIAITS